MRKIGHSWTSTQEPLGMLGYPWLSGMSRMVDNGTKKGIIERTGHVRVKKKILSLKRDSSPCLPYRIIRTAFLRKKKKTKSKEKSARTSRPVWVGWELYELGKAMKDMNSLGQHINQVHRR